MNIQYPILNTLRPTHNIRVRHRAGDDRLLEQSIEEETARPGTAAVEAEHEFVQISIEVLRLDRAVMRAENPALDQ